MLQRLGNLIGEPHLSGLLLSGQDQEAFDKSGFKHFDILSEDSATSDHHYGGSNMVKKAQDVFSNPTSAVSRKIAKEWRILERDLPESIYVRVYEQRIDLLRAAIVGAPGTPYHDGLFFFDIVLPPEYPNQPPKVHYHAHGHRLNPNLYASGFVCLSLINTWGGTGVEKWTPSSSTILQILVSIQGLVLNDKPYFNEPGFGVGLKQLKGSKWSGYWRKKYMDYNQDVFVLSCKTMMLKLKKPPRGFESLVFEHFRQRQDVILAAIKAYRDGTAVVGRYRQDGSSSTSLVPISYAFKCRLSKTHSDLRKAFIQYGISPANAREDSQLLTASKSQATEKRRTKGIGSKIIKALKKILG